MLTGAASAVSSVDAPAVSVQRLDGDSVTVGLGLQGDITPVVGWRVGYDAGIATRDGTMSHGLTAGVRIGL